MKNIVFFGIAVRIIVLFSTGFLISFANPWLHEFFGDKPQAYDGSLDGSWKWAAAHYWYFWCMFFLFLLSVVNFVVSTVNIVKKNYDTENWG